MGSKQSWSTDGTARYRQSKEVSILWSHHEETRELPRERDNARNNARCTQARKTTHGLDGQHQTWTGFPEEESVRMTEDRYKWRKYVHVVANPRVESGQRTEQNRCETVVMTSGEWHDIVVQ